MENEQAFEIEADIDATARLRPTSRASYQSLHKGQDIMNTAYGGYESQQQTHSEHSPLLARDAEQHGEVIDASGDDGPDSRRPPAWDGERDFEGRPWWNKPSVFWLLPPFLLFTIAFGGTVVPKLDLILNLVCQEYFSERSTKDTSSPVVPVIQGAENTQCRIPEVQALVSKFTLYCQLIPGVLSALTSPKLGALSDRYGRTRLICISTLGMMMSEIITVIVATYPDIFSVNWILVGYMFDGLGGSFIAPMALSYAYASDCTPPERRNVVFGYYHGCLFAGIALGPIIAGYIVKRTGQILSVFYVAVIAHGAFFLFLILVVPESLTKARQLKARDKTDFVGPGEQNLESWLSYSKKFIRGGNPLAPLTILWPTGKGINPAIRRNLVLLAAVDTTMFGVAMGSLTVTLLYSEFMFGWDTFQTSVLVSIVNGCRVITLIVLLPTATRLVRGPRSQSTQRNSGSDQFDLAVIRLAIFFDMLGFAGYATVRTGPLFILCGAIAAIGGMGSPTLSAALTKHVPPDRTGQVLGAMGLLHASARVVAPVIFNLVYAKTVGKFTQTVFVCLAGTFGMAFLLSWFIRPHVYWDEPTPISNDDTTDDTAQEEGTTTVR